MMLMQVLARHLHLSLMGQGFPGENAVMQIIAPSPARGSGIDGKLDAAICY